jgi:hypothetical protein
VTRKKRCLGHFIKFRFFSHFLAILSNWRLRKTNRYLRNKKKTLFFAILSKFGVSSFLDIFESLAASEIEQVASKYEKKTFFGHFINIRRFRSFLAFFGF